MPQSKLYIQGDTISGQIPEYSDTTGCPLKAGLEEHVWPGNGKGIVTKTSSDAIFWPDGIGLASSMWMKLLSFLARTGIQDQTGSKPGETDIEACVKGWGLFKSRFLETGVDEAQLERFLCF